MKGISRFMSVFLVLMLTLSCSACSSGSFTAGGEEENVEELIIDGDNMPELFISMTENTSKSLVFTLSDEQAAQVKKAGAGKVAWTLHRNAPYANPADGKFIPLHGEEKMFPGEKETIDFATISFNDANESGQAFSMKKEYQWQLCRVFRCPFLRHIDPEIIPSLDYAMVGYELSLCRQLKS